MKYQSKINPLMSYREMFNIIFYCFAQQASFPLTLKQLFLFASGRRLFRGNDLEGPLIGYGFDCRFGIIEFFSGGVFGEVQATGAKRGDKLFTEKIRRLSGLVISGMLEIRVSAAIILHPVPINRIIQLILYHLSNPS